LLPSGKQTVFANRVHWAKTYLGKAGLIESTRRGYFKITASGRQVVESKPPRIDNNFLSQFEEFEKWRGSDQEAEQLSAAPAIVNQKETPDEIMRAAHRQIETALAQELLDRFLTADNLTSGNIFIDSIVSKDEINAFGLMEDHAV